MTNNKRQAEVQKELEKRGIANAEVPEGAPEPEVKGEGVSEVRNVVTPAGKEVKFRVVHN